MPTVNKILELFQVSGNSQYGSEAVSQLEHALQAATLAESENAAPELITAALLHDVGHLLHDLPDEAPEMGVDDHHENSGRHFLVDCFPGSVTEPIRLHVDAKRYLCAVDESYQNQLSPPSIVSMKLQGGVMSDQEVRTFEANPDSDDAIRLRKWDDLAKVAGLETPPLLHFKKYLEAVHLDDSEGSD